MHSPDFEILSSEILESTKLDEILVGKLYRPAWVFCFLLVDTGFDCSVERGEDNLDSEDEVSLIADADILLRGFMKEFEGKEGGQ